MASSYSAPIGASQVGSYFVKQYYLVLQQQPDYVHQFYTDESSVVRVDGESTDSASALMQIHTLIMSMSFSNIKVKTINSLESWNGGVLVVVSGSVKPKDFGGWRNFVQTFFLAPQEKGYFVLNDVFHFANEEGIEQSPAPVVSQNNHDAQPTASNSHAESPAVHDYGLEAEATEYVNSVQIRGNEGVEDYSYTDYPEHDHVHQYEAEHEAEPEPEVEEEDEEEEETQLEEETVQFRSSEQETALSNNEVEHVPEPEPEPVVEEHVGEASKLSYASILRAPKGKPAPSIRVQQSYPKSTPPVTEWQAPVEQSNSMFPPVADTSVDWADDGFSQEVESKSVYVRNLPSTISTLDILQEFSNFGKIKQDGVFLKNRKDVGGACYAFVEFEDIQGVENSIKASPIQLAGKQVYIEERRPNTSSISRGGRRGGGRGRGGRPGGRNFGRGSYPDDRVRSNGFRGM